MPNDLKRVLPIDLTSEMRKAYIDYAMSVIVSRAIPDVRDGLKPVQRRILFTMNELSLLHNKPHCKCVKTVGEVMGSYHPHGNEAIYMAMVHLGQKWNLRYTLVDGQGNFGSVDGDEPAAMRYTEARMSRLSEEMLFDIDKETVDWIPNFDETKEEPVVLPSKIPNLLVNGTSGIAVGMATNMAPHNLKEVCDGVMAYIDNRDITVTELMQYILAPDFPTGGIICGTKGIVEAYTTGKGKVVVRGKTEIVDNEHGKSQIIISEIPFLVNKALLIERIADLINEKKIDGISDIRDESDKQGLRIVVDIKRDAVAQVVLNNLFANTALQSAFNINNVCLVNGRPMTLGLKDLIKYFYEHRHTVVLRRTVFELKQAKARVHVLEGYIIALDNIDPIIQLIKSSPTSAVAIDNLRREYGLDETQGKSILEMKLQKLTGLEREKILKEHAELVERIKHLEAILSDDVLVKGIIKDELEDIKNRFGDIRRTQIRHEMTNISVKDVISDEEVVISLSQQGYLKRTLLSDYKLQNRGGVGAKGSAIKEDDFIKYITVSSTHKFLLVFTVRGNMFWEHVYNLPVGTKNSKGRAIQNIFPISPEDKISCVLAVDNLKDEDYVSSHYLIFATKKGLIKKTILKDYCNVRYNGIRAIEIRGDDELLKVSVTDGTNEIILATKDGKAIRFNENTIRPSGRITMGVRGVVVRSNNIKNKNEVVGMVTLDLKNKDKTLLVVSEYGSGKRSNIEDYRVTSRGCVGVKTIDITSKTGELVAIEDVTDEDELILINNAGIAIRIAVKDIRVIGRITQGVILKKTAEGEVIMSIAKIKTV
ncbi:MAG: DNA gyrase subunit A [Cytophagales bacterium]|nr:DNA gyrase subunit A [Cytophagales bacterium]